VVPNGLVARYFQGILVSITPKLNHYLEGVT